MNPLTTITQSIALTITPQGHHNRKNFKHKVFIWIYIYIYIYINIYSTAAILALFSGYQISQSLTFLQICYWRWRHLWTGRLYALAWCLSWLFSGPVFFFKSFLVYSDPWWLISFSLVVHYNFLPCMIYFSAKIIGLQFFILYFSSNSTSSVLIL